MNRLMYSLLNRLVEFIIHRKAGQKNGPANSDTQAVPLTQVNRGLRDMGVLLREIITKLQEIERQHKTIRTHSSNAWSEREMVLADYYNTLRAVLQVLDNCESALSSSPQMLVIYEGLKRIIEDQHIEPIQVKEGDLFDTQFHKCEETVEMEEYPTGVVVQVIEKGYIQKRRDGSKIVIRPAKVHVNKKLLTEGIRQ